MAREVEWRPRMVNLEAEYEKGAAKRRVGVRPKPKYSAPKLPLSAKPVNKAELHLHREGEELIAYDGKGHKLYSFNPTAHYIFNLCDGYRTVKEIIDIVAMGYDTRVEQVRDDVLELLTEAAHRGLIHFTT